MSTTSTTSPILDQPAVCVANDPGCEPGWPCLACCDAMKVPAVHLVGIGETTRLPSGDGSGRRNAEVEPATEKQIGFLTKLVRTKCDPAVVTDSEEFIADIVKGGKRVVSKMIDGLLKLPDFVAEGAAPAPATYRWTKVDGEWLVKGPAVKFDDSITITKASGETSEAIVTEVVAEGLFRVRKAEAQTSTGSLPDVPEGHYAVRSEGTNDLVFLRVDRPSEGQWAGRTFVKMIVGGHPDSKVWGKAAATLLGRVLEAGVDEARTLYGQEIGKCWVCNRDLTKRYSRHLGIGPDCADRLGVHFDHAEYDRSENVED